MKVLAIKLRAIGDTVIWTSALQALRETYPSVEVHVLTYASNAAVLESHPAVNVRHFLKTNSRLELMRKLWELRTQKWDWLLGFHATTSLCRWAWLAKPNNMVLHHHSWTKTPRGSQPVPFPGKLEDAISRDHRVLEAMGIRGNPPATRIVIRAEEKEKAEQIVAKEIAAKGGNVSLPRLLFLPGAGHHLRRLPKDMWLPLAEKVRAEGLYQPVVVVDKTLSNELNLKEECAKLPLIDNGNLREFLAFISMGQRALANDSGPGHMAVALGLKTTFAFGPGCVGDWHPYDSTINPVYRVAVPCRAQGPRDQEKFQFCTVDTCSHHRCMRELKIDFKTLTAQ